MAEVVRIELGSSILQGERIAQEACAAGLSVQLLRNEHPETGASVALGSCALLVSTDDEADLRRPLAEYGYKPEHATAGVQVNSQPARRDEGRTGWV